VVEIHREIARRLHSQIEAPVPGHLSQHVVEEWDGGLDPMLARAVEMERHPDVGFGRLALNDRSATHVTPLG